MPSSLRPPTISVVALLVASITAGIVGSCSRGDDDVIEPGGTTTGGDHSCSGEGNLAILWDIQNGTLRLPKKLPIPGLDWVDYAHVNWPLLRFLRPPGFQTLTVTAPDTIGVDVLRDDVAALYHFLSTWDSSDATPEQWLNQTVARALTLLGTNGTAEIRCSASGTESLASGVERRTASMVIATDDVVVLGSVSMTFVDGLSGHNVAVTTMAALRGEFDAVADDLFFPILFQVGIGRSIHDSDNDGVADEVDRFPYDPTQQ